MEGASIRRTLAFTNLRLIDGSGADARVDASVVIEEGVIRAIGPLGGLPDGTELIDLGGRTLMPGLIDAHIHLATWGQNLLSEREHSVPYLVARSVQAMRTVLDAGCTGARDCGGLDAGLRDAVRDGLIPGPAIATSLTIVSPTDGLIDPVDRQGNRSPSLRSIPAPDADGPDAVRAKIREILRAGADFIKVATTGGVSSPRVHPGRTLYTPEELDAAVDEAHRAGVRVACHAIGRAGVAMAIAAGVDSLEHGAELDPDLARAMADHGTWYVPTLAVYRWHETLGTPLRRERALAIHDAHRRSLTCARDAGVPIAMGSDAGGYGFDFSLELELLVEAGMTPLEAIRAGTAGSAECAGWAGRRGRIAIGHDADLLVVDGEPDRDIRVLRDRDNIVSVWQRGAIVGGRDRTTQRSRTDLGS